MLKLYSGIPFPELRSYAERELGLEISHTSPANVNKPKPPPRMQNEGFEKAIKGYYAKISTEGKSHFSFAIVIFFRQRSFISRSCSFY